MTRTERTWHWRIWLLLVPLLALLFFLALMQRPDVRRAAETASHVAQGGQP